MKRAIVLWGLLFVSLLSCSDEEPLLADIQKVVEVDLAISSNRTDSQGDVILSETTDIVADDFTEYLNRIRDFEVNECRISFQPFSENPGQPTAVTFETFELQLSSLQVGSQAIDLIELANFVLPQGNTSMVLFRRDSANSSEINNAMSFLRSRLLREEAFNWDIEGQVQGLGPGGHIEIKLLLDLTAEVILP